MCTVGTTLAQVTFTANGGIEINCITVLPMTNPSTVLCTEKLCHKSVSFPEEDLGLPRSFVNRKALGRPGINLTLKLL